MEENNSGDKVDVKQRSRKKLKTFLFCCGKLHWPGDYGGPMFLLPGLVITLYATGALNTVLSKDHQYEICRYLYNHQASNVHCVNVLSIFDPDRCLEHMNGQGIIHCLQKYGYVLTFFLFIQKKAIFEKLGPTIDAAGASGVNILCCRKHG
ncbi:uncharacterized protein [Gossypium hirsutum]|uniref:Uncharacterized protein isoform X6 n=1 Tax=Gossypium hirsutum TaxID=3635 RepID=A0A1U8I8K6_GOSHI|nr:uncharacterized protein LOC107892090 isoform X6 [Gossypium hirsutum]